MNRRLRKKKRTGEFTEFGFIIAMLLKPECSEEEVDKFADEFIDTIEANKMVCGGGWNTKDRTFNLLVSSDIHRGNSKRMYLSVTLEQRDAIREWCSKHDKILNFNIGELVDTWK